MTRALAILAAVAGAVALAWWYLARERDPAPLPSSDVDGEGWNDAPGEPDALSGGPGMEGPRVLADVPVPAPRASGWRARVVDAATQLRQATLDVERVAPGYSGRARAVAASRIADAAPTATRAVLLALLLGVPPYNSGAASRSPSLRAALDAVNAARLELRAALDAPLTLATAPPAGVVDFGLRVLN